MARRPFRAVTAASITDLQRDIARREARTEVRQRPELLLERLAGLEAEPGGNPSARAQHARRDRSRRSRGRPRGLRPRTAIHFTDAIAAVPEGKTLGVAEAAEAIRNADYKSNVASFRIMVIGLLPKPPFGRVARREYTVVRRFRSPASN